MTNLDKVRIMTESYRNTPFTIDQLVIATGLSPVQVARSIRDLKIAGLTKRNDGRLQIKGRTVKDG